MKKLLTILMVICLLVVSALMLCACDDDSAGDSMTYGSGHIVQVEDLRVSTIFTQIMMGTAHSCI